MKYFFFILLFISAATKAQDTLVLKDSTKIVSLVLLLGDENIRYKKLDNLAGPDLYIANTKVNLVKYKNGRRVNVDSLYQIYTKSGKLQQQNTVASTAPQSGPEDMYKLGKFHAEINYNCRGCTAGFTGLGLLMGPFSVIPGLSTMFVTPSNKKLSYPSEELWLDKDYQRGYKEKARSTKRRAIGTGLWIGNSLSFFGWAILVSTLQKN